MEAITPFDVNGQVGQALDYTDTIRQFGCSEMTSEVLSLFRGVTGEEPHVLMQRGVVCSHRGFDQLLKHHADGGKWYLYTGRGPSSDGLHLGHLVPMQLTAWLQRVFNVPVVIQITDDEKYLFKDGLSLEKLEKMAHNNIGDILACGFNPEKTFVFRNTQFIQHLYPMVLKIQKQVTTHHSQATFGFTDQSNIGQVSFPAIQAAPSFAETFRSIFGDAKSGSGSGNYRTVRCLIPCAIDQDPYFRMTRAIAKKLNLPSPWLLHTIFLPGLDGVHTKMSASKPESAIFVTDGKKKIQKKVNKSYSGGQELLEDHRKYGGEPDIDVSCNILRFFEPSTSVWKTAVEQFKSGELTCGEVKKMAGSIVVKIIQEFNASRELVDDQLIEAVQKVRPISVNNDPTEGIVNSGSSSN
jgi:tryptophanyl-tRNA synthetase